MASGSRVLRGNAAFAHGVSDRIRKLQTAVAERVVDLAVRKRNWSVAVLQNIVDRTLATIEPRSVMYSNQMGESHRRQAQDLTAEKAAIGLGFFEVDDIGKDWLSPASTRQLQIGFLYFLYTFLISRPLHCEGVVALARVVDTSKTRELLSAFRRR